MSVSCHICGIEAKVAHASRRFCAVSFHQDKERGENTCQNIGMPVFVEVVAPVPERFFTSLALEEQVGPSGVKSFLGFLKDGGGRHP